MTLHSSRSHLPARTLWNVRHHTVRPTLPPLTERVQVSWLSSDTGEAQEAVRGIPAMPLFANAFGAFVRGGIVSTVEGPVAVEDLLPGDRVVTAEGSMPLLWKGTRTYARPRSGTTFFRIPADALGLARPAPDLLLGPAARIVARRTEAGPTLVPVSALVDSTTVVAITPISAVQTFHLAFAHHVSFALNGVEVESHHPGEIGPQIGQDALALYLSLFPHLRGMEDFGPLRLPRPRHAEDARRFAP